MRALITAMVLLHVFAAHADSTSPARARLLRVQRHDLERRLALSATVAAGERSELSASSNGLIDRVLARPGERVKKGQLLATLTAQEPTGRQRTVKIVAPFDGEVSAASAHLGAFVVAGGPSLFTIVALDKMRVSVAAPEREARSVRPGASVRLSVEAYPDRVYDTRVQRVQPEIDPAAHTFLVESLVDNLDHLLWPGMSGHASILVEQHANALVLPPAAITHEEARAWIFRLSTDGTAQRAPVTLGLSEGGWIEIVAGVVEGDAVLVADAPLRDGAAVSVTH